MWKNGLIHLIMMKIMKGHLKLELIKKYMENELGEKIMSEFCSPRAKTYAFLSDDDDKEIKKVKGTKKYIIKRKLMSENFRDSIFNNKITMRSQLRFKSGYHDMFTEEVNKIALNYTDDKRLRTFDAITTYSRGANTFKVCDSEMLVRKKVIPIKLYYNKI